MTYTLPVADGNSNYVLTTNGSGQLSWQSASGVGAGTIDAVGNITTGAAFTGSDLGNELTFNGSTSVSEPNHIILTAVEPSSSLTYTLPDIGTNGTFAFLEGNQTFTGTKTFNDINIADTDVAFTGGSTTFDLQQGSTSTLTLLNSNGRMSQILIFQTAVSRQTAQPGSPMPAT